MVSGRNGNGNRFLTWEWVGMGMGMGMVLWEWEGMGTEIVLPGHLYSVVHATTSITVFLLYLL